MTDPTSPQDPLEDRLRDALRRPGPSYQLDPDDLLRTVHSRARRRRAQRLVGACVVVAAIVGGGFTVLPGVLDDGGTPATDHQARGTDSPTGGSTSGPGPSTAPPTARSSGGSTAADAVPVSLTATGTAYQWVLAGLDDGSCATTRCAVVYSTANAGDSWSGPARLHLQVSTTAGAATSPPTNEVGQLRFSRPQSGGPANGWAYGGALESTHDSGLHWRRVTLPVAGSVTHLEAWRSDVYATVDTGSGTVVVRSPAEKDAWSIVDTGVPLTSVRALAASRGEIAFIAETGDGRAPHVVVSVDGSNWSVRSACPTSAPASQLSAAADAASTTDALWLLCSSPTKSLVKVTVDSGIRWTPVQAPAGPVTLAARSTDSSVAVTTGSVDLLRPGSAPTRLAALPVGNAVFAGFTNPTTGYVIAADGRMWRSADAGARWVDYSVH